jgi:hypothetical protein
VHNIILVTIAQGTSDLPHEFTSNPFSTMAMTDEVIQHMGAIHILEDHVVMMLVNDHFTHAANVWMMEKHRDGGLTQGLNLIGRVCRRLFGDSL